LNGQKLQRALGTQAVMRKKQVLMSKPEIVSFEKIEEASLLASVSR
jgi:hypothetical protein